MAPEFQGKEVNQHSYMYWEHEGNEAIRKGNWKAIKDSNKKNWELYDLSSDRIETKNFANEHPEIMKELITKWEEWAHSHFVFPKHKEETK
jgi:arylsulfatase A-like enzyme